MNKTELESKHIAELHTLAAEAGIDGYRMLSRQDLIDRLAGGEPAEPGEREPRQRSSRGRSDRSRQRRQPREGRQPRERKPREEREEQPREREKAPAEPAPPPPSAEPVIAAPERPKRRRRRFRRRGRKGIRIHDLLLPAAPGRQAIVYAESREACTALLRGIAGELSGAKGPDPIGLLIDPSPEELAEWRREAPQAEIVAAGQAHHAADAIAQAARRAQEGEDVIVLIDSLSRFADGFADGEEAKELFEAGRSVAGTGSLTVVAAVERQS